jgi:DNA-3-methyladenine glycosylase
MDRIYPSFYQRPTDQVAEDLIGKLLVRRIEENGHARRLSGIIVEAEAYGYADDAASHAYRGMTKRNSVMFGQVGVAYVYFTYGNHFCLNVSARSSSEAAGAVLIRSIEPVEGTDIMKKLRHAEDVHSLTSGPGKLTQALEIDLGQNGVDMTDPASELCIEQGTKRQAVATQRIGITRAVDKKWRFIDPTSPFLSRRFR